MSDPLANVGMVMMSEARYLLIDLAKRLRHRHGSALHVYATTRQDADFYESINQDGLFASVNDAGVLMRSALEPVADEAAVLARARHFERKIGETYNRVAVAHRHFGRGYALGGFHHPRSRVSQHATYGQLLQAYNKTFEFWEREFAEKQLSLVVNGGKEVCCIARANGVPYRSYASARYKNYHYWTSDEYWSHPDLERTYRKIVSEAQAADIANPYLSEGSQRRRFLKRARLEVMVGRLGWIVMQNLYWRLRGYDKVTGYLLRDRLRHEVRRCVGIRRLNRAGYAKLDEIDGPFVFYPLHTEPEASIGRFSPEYFSQLTAIATLARDLPAGVRLAVKETIYSAGRRPDNFYDQIADLKNVVMLDIWERGVDVVRQAAAVATITGTAGLEGAAMGKPIISFGQHNIYEFLPHVFVVRDDCDLREILRCALEEVSPKRARADGARFLQALEASCFDLGNYDYVDLNSYDDDTVERAYQALVQSLDIEHRVKTAAS